MRVVLNAPLFVKGLGLDSIDALELGVGLQKKYGIKLSGSNTGSGSRCRAEPPPWC